MENMKKTKTTDDVIADLLKQVEELQQLVNQLKGEMFAIERELYK